MEPICEFDDDDAEIIHHGDEHLAQTLDRTLFPTVFDGRELGESFTYDCHIMPESFFYICLCLCCILYDVMEDTRLDRYEIRFEGEEEFDSLKWMGDVWFATLPELSFVRIPRKYIGIPDDLLYILFCLHISLHNSDNLVYEFI